MKLFVILFLSLALFAGNQVNGQKNNKKILVSGIVTDSNNNLVSGAMILVDKKNTSVTTNSNGFFKVKVRPDAKTIGAFIFSIGSGEISFNGKTPVKIVLVRTFSVKADTIKKTLPDEKINMGYGSMDKKDIQSSSQIDARENRFSAYTNIYDLIRGEVPGVQVTNNKVLIRGVTSINASTDPLLVVNGMVVGSIDQISPREVKTITVLKGAETAIYGSRGANGVIVIELIGAEKVK